MTTTNRYFATFVPNAPSGTPNIYSLGEWDTNLSLPPNTVPVPDDVAAEMFRKLSTARYENGEIIYVVPPTTPDTIAAERYNHEVAGVFFQASAASSAALVGTARDDQSKISSARALATANEWPADPGAPWKMADGTFMMMTKDDIIAMSSKVAGYVLACYANESALVNELHNIGTVDLTQGWPNQV